MLPVQSPGAGQSGFGGNQKSRRPAFPGDGITLGPQGKGRGSGISKKLSLHAYGICSEGIRSKFQQANARYLYLAAPPDRRSLPLPFGPGDFFGFLYLRPGRILKNPIAFSPDRCYDVTIGRAVHSVAASYFEQSRIVLDLFDYHLWQTACHIFS